MKDLPITCGVMRAYAGYASLALGVLAYSKSNCETPPRGRDCPRKTPHNPATDLTALASAPPRTGKAVQGGAVRRAPDYPHGNPALKAINANAVREIQVPQSAAPEIARDPFNDEEWPDE